MEIHVHSTLAMAEVGKKERYVEKCMAHGIGGLLANTVHCLNSKSR